MDKFSIYKAPIKHNKHPFENISIAEAANLIKSDKFMPITEKLRGLKSKDERNSLKETKLHYVTFSGTFKHRAKDAILQRSNYFCIDFDHIGGFEAIEGFKSLILKIHKPALVFVSPSGDGLKVVYKIDTTQGEHEQYYKAFEAFFKDDLLFSESVGSWFDTSCKDVSRATFLCYDPECFYSENPTILGADFLKEYSAPGNDLQTISANDPQMIPPGDQQTIIENLEAWANKKLSFTPGQRNEYITILSGAFNRYGLERKEAINYLMKFAEDGFPEKQIATTVNSIYTNYKKLHGTVSFTSDPDQDFRELEEPTPPMPINGFPNFIQELINECSRVNGTNRDFWAAALFSATSAALGQSVIIKDKYENSPLLWLAVVGASGTGKSEPLKFAFDPIHERDFRTFRNYTGLCDMYAANTDKNKGPKPTQPAQTVIVESTPEAMAKALNANQRGISIVRDELMGWISDFNKYNKSGEQQNMLSIWSQSPVKINRASGDNLFIKEPFVNVFGGIQPGVLSEMSKDNRAVNGFLPRFCFVFPDRSEAPTYQHETISDKLKDDYRKYIDFLLSIGTYRDEILLSVEASNLYAEFYDKNARLNNSGSQPDHLAEVNSKLNIIVLRSALILHLSNRACSGVHETHISSDTMKAAVELAEYFRATANKVYQIISQRQATADKKELIKHLHTLGNSQTDIAKVLKISQQYVGKVLKN